MKKMIALVVVVSGVFFFALDIGRYPGIGHLAYNNITDVEANIYGFTQSKVDIDELSISLYESEYDPKKSTLLMLHGYSADKDVWPRFARHFLDDYNVIIPDMAGHGDTGFDRQWGYRIPKQASRLIELLDVMGVGKVHVIGNSMGGFIAAHLAKDYPDRILSSLLIDPAGVRSPKNSDMDNMLSQGRNPFEIHSRSEFNEFYAMTMAQPPWLPDFVLGAVNEKYQNRREQLKWIFSDFHHQDMLDNELHNIVSPVLLLWGKEDRILHVSSTDVWEAGVDNITIEVFSGVGHMPMVEVPIRTADLYKAFLDNLGFGDEA